MKYHKDGSQAKEETIFVFGSNESGIHGAGAALAAKRYYGAVYGKGVGLVGQSYGIPTKDKKIKTLPISEIQRYVKDFVKFSRENKDLNFLITRVGCGLAGYSDKDIAPLFRGIGDNCSVAYEWKEYLED